VQSNSYTPRLRQAFADYDDAPWQTYGLAGQAWSLATPFKTGLDPFQRATPPTIDGLYVAGYDYLRVPVLRVVKGFGPVWLGLEADSPQTVVGGSPSSLTPSAPCVSAGNCLYTSYAGGGGLNPQQSYSVNAMPDLIGKAAVDTAYGHYEVFGVLRQFETQVSFPTNKAGTTGRSENFSATGGGVGATAFIPVTQYAEFQGDVMTGHGIGRYGAAGLSDVTFGLNGAPQPLYEVMGMAGITGHVLPGLDIYAMGGIEQQGRSYFNARVGGSTVSGGYGNPAFNNAGCFNPNAGSGCAGNNYRLSLWTVGYNWKAWEGPFGAVQTGLQYEYGVREAYGGKGGKPTGIDNMVFANVRYIPF